MPSPALLDEIRIAAARSGSASYLSDQLLARGVETAFKLLDDRA
jgi:hypothetical protein